MSSITRCLRRAFSTSAAAITNPVKLDSNKLYKERNLKRLVEKFKKASESDRFRTKSGIYVDTVRRLAAAKRFRWIEEILEEQKKYDDISKEGFAVRLISLYGKSGMLDNAQKTFDEMPDRNCERTVLSFNALLAACVSSKKFDKIEGYFRELPAKLSVKPDLVTFNIVLKGFCEKKSFDLAISLLDEMEKNGKIGDLVTFNTLLHGLYGNGQFSDGEGIWDRMEKNKVTPDIRSYNAKLHGLICEKKTSEAVELIEQMKTKEIKPDVFSYNELIKGFVNEGNIEQAKHWYNEIKKSDFDPSKVTFAKLVPFLIEKGDLELAYEMCEEIFISRCLVQTSLLQLMVDELFKNSKIDEAKKLVHLGKTNSYRRYRLTLPSDK